jgi:hypothetical protein
MSRGTVCTGAPGYIGNRHLSRLPHYLCHILELFALTYWNPYLTANGSAWRRWLEQQVAVFPK